ncbi:SURF1 family protein [Halioxenophilus sp. WMMB6]|uniref:SURF1 family protein n=1 Tax=Halioxenophilus sp. WMMB6 TaxID=3073815 RepID=UPI00295EDC6C|nr:SURF1 family protein [Halioxenophilus sp. WMMB6]
MPGIAAIRNIQWQINKTAALFFCCFFVMFIGLGFWQIERAGQKKVWLETRGFNAAIEPQQVSWLSDFTGGEFSRVSLRGHYDLTHYWLLQNQVLDGIVGEDLLVPFITGAGEAVLVNLGWREESVWRKNSGQPQHLPSGAVTITAVLRKPFDLPFVSNIFEGGQASVLEVVPGDFPYTNLEANWYLQLDPSQPEALLTHWQMNTITPAKHIGYAVQWFTMAAVLLFAFLVTNSNLVSLWRVPKQQRQR